MRKGGHRKRGFEDLLGALQRSHQCAEHPPLTRSTSPENAHWWWEQVKHCSAYMQRDHLRWFGRHDLWFLLVFLLNRRHFVVDERKTKWTFARCNEVQDEPNNCLDLWHRESYKSEIITFGLTVQDILNNPEITFGFFSHTRPMAKDFLVLIKREFEFNALLKEIYDDVLWENPRLECRAASVSWSENEGITVKRSGNPKEATVEAWGLVDGQPVGKRYLRLVYDDPVARDNISPLMIQITTESFDNSLLMTAADPPVFRYVATYQEFGDTTQKLIDRGVGKLRLHSALDEYHNPACLSDAKFAFFKQTLTPKVFALQILLDPSQARDPAEVGFSRDWIDYYDPKDLSLNGMNRYVLVDPAGAGHEANSKYAQWVVALGADKCVRVLDIIRDNFDLEERWQAVLEAVTKYDPLKVAYERYAMQSDIEHFKFRMRELNQLFNITEVRGGVSKDARIGWLVPVFRDRRILFPKYGLRKKLKDGREVDMVRQFIDDEFLLWPYNPKQRDLLDALSRLFDPGLNVVWPRRYRDATEYRSADEFTGTAPGSWMSE